MQRFINHWQTALIAPLSASAEQLQVPAVAASLLSFSGGSWYKLTITNTTRSAWEIVTATASEGGALVVSRGQEMTTAADWPAGSLVFVELTAQAMHGVLDAIAALEARLAALEGSSGATLTDSLGRVLSDSQGRVLEGL